MDTIRFNSSGYEDFKFLSNFYDAPITIDGRVYATVEHFYQACKTEDPVEHESVRTCAAPLEAKRAGAKLTLRQGWDEVKLGYMRQALDAKFSQHSGLRDGLLCTEGCELVEHTPWGDYFWGDGGDGTGKNILGKMLMQIRDYIRSQP